MQTSSELEQSFKGPGFTLTFIYYFGLSALIVAIATARLLHLSIQSALPYQYGIAFALPFGLINALTKKSRTLTVAFKQKGEFAAQLNSALSELNFQPKSDPESEDEVSYQTFRRGGISGWLAGEIYVAIAAQEAVIAGRSSWIRKLADRVE
ncbi:MAG: hypothetical protein AAGB01_10380 [Cyanobacteria bacterium P01_F01_bin.42]